jgi:hypothetical protein
MTDSLHWRILMPKISALVLCIFAALLLNMGTILAEDARPATGTFLKESPMDGRGVLSIINNGNDDAVAVLSEAGRGIKSAVFIRAEDNFNITGIDDGSYDLYFLQGQSWNSSTSRFDVGLRRSRTNEPMAFKTTSTAEGISYSMWDVTLEEVANGNVDKDPVSEEEFPNLK